MDYEDLYEVISFAGFDWNKYRQGEEDILKVRLERKGFTGIVFKMGEQDSFGPLTRICLCFDSEGKRRRFIYG